MNDVPRRLGPGISIRVRRPPAGVGGSTGITDGCIMRIP